MVIVESYNPQWKNAFEALSKALYSILGGLDIAIEHVGSTAVPGMAAKPILDLDIVPADETDLPEMANRLERAGYHNRGDQGIPGRFAFRQSSPATPVYQDVSHWQEHHLYVCLRNSVSLKNHLFMRDALLKDPQLVASYSALKAALAAEEGITRETYSKQKTAFILRVLSDCGFEAEALEAIRKANT
jgi:GrpB-like predicted nucleotidyltransferase (UPF0157 family)